jgi:Cu/Ag efflux protein CusF
MRKLITAVAAAALLSTASLAYAAEASGSIQSIDTAAGTITLDNGDVFKLPAAFDVASLQVGAKVKIVFEEQDGQKVASSVEADAMAPAQ